MKVYVLQHHWDTPDNEGTEVLGVYGDDHLEMARATMRAGADWLKKEYEDTYAGDWEWDEDGTWEDDNSIHLFYDSRSLYQAATVYSWEIVKMEVQ